MIVFENRGEIDPVAMTTFGVSVKVGDNPIGFFGTGFKYAVAVLLRTGHHITVHSGEDAFRFSTRRADVRGKDFEFVDVSVNEGSQTPVGFTTELGKTWELWMAYRELYCNARDEGGEVYEVARADQASDPRRDTTLILVNGPEIGEVHRERALYFLEGEPDVTCDEVGIYRRPSSVLFYRGVRILRLPRPATFTYNLLGRISLTEDRTMAHPFMAEWYLTRALTQCDDASILEEAIVATRDSLEREFDYRSCGVTPKEPFLAAVGKLAEVDEQSVAPHALSAWRFLRPAQFVPKVSLDIGNDHCIERLMRRCQAVGCGLGMPPVIVEELPDGMAVMERNGIYYIATAALADERVLLVDMLQSRVNVEASPLAFAVEALADLAETQCS